MARIRINAYGVSESVNLLTSEINRMHPTANTPLCMKLSSSIEDSRFQGRSGDVIINWGSSRAIPDRVKGSAIVLNLPAFVNRAANKLTAFTAMRSGNVNAVENTTSSEEAQSWVDAGHHVFCRTELRGHSGEGIVVTALNEPEDLGSVEWSTTLPEAPLYTKGINGQHREYRIHVFKGQVLFIQQKRRVAGYRELENYSNVVRNHANGWIYGHLNMTQPDDVVIEQAVRAVSSLGLDFGAVDVLSRRGEAWVLEVNTAPGLSGETNRDNYARAILAVFNREPVVGIREVNQVLDDSEEEPAVLSFDDEETSQMPIPEEELIVSADIESTEAWSPTPPETPMFFASTAPARNLSATAEAAPVTWYPITAPEVGDTVRIEASSPHLASGRNNPTQDVTGTISEVFERVNDSHYAIRVSWNNGYRNNYRWSDLQTTKEPVDSVASPAEQEPTTVTVSSEGVSLTNGNYYVIEITSEGDSLRKVGEYCATNNGFWDTGMDLKRVGEVTVIREINLND